jgi:hypothetical protein
LNLPLPAGEELWVIESHTGRIPHNEERPVCGLDLYWTCTRAVALKTNVPVLVLEALEPPPTAPSTPLPTPAQTSQALPKTTEVPEERKPLHLEGDRLEAQRAGRGIGLKDLKGIREWVKANRTLFVRGMNIWTWLLNRFRFFAQLGPAIDVTRKNSLPEEKCL